jgi:hypothetical protein
MTVKEAVDEVQIPRTATPGADREMAGQVGLGACGKGRDFLVSHVHPFNLPVTTQGIGDPVQAVAHHAVDAFDARGEQGVDELIRNSHSHGNFLDLR